MSVLLWVKRYQRCVPVQHRKIAILYLSTMQ